MEIFKDPPFLITFVLSILLTGLLTAVQAHADEDISDELVDLSVQIVRDYRELRLSCSDKEDEAMRMCYYRLRIGLWDYKQARETLQKKGIHLEAESSAQVAQH